MKYTGLVRLSQVVWCPALDFSNLFSLLRKAELVPRHIKTAGVLSWYLRHPSTGVESPPVTCGLREPLGVAWNEIGPGGLRHRHHHHGRDNTLGLVWNNRKSNNSQTSPALPSTSVAQNQNIDNRKINISLSLILKILNNEVKYSISTVSNNIKNNNDNKNKIAFFLQRQWANIFINNQRQFPTEILDFKAILFSYLKTRWKTFIGGSSQGN